MSAPASRRTTRRARRRPARPLHAAGRTLVELMVTVVIGLAIVVALVAMYSSSSRAARSAGAGATAEASANALMTLLGDAVKAAGYGEIVGTDFVPGAGQTLFDGNAVIGCRNGRFADPAAGDFGCVAGGDSDALMVSFQAESVRSAPQGAQRDCLGAAAPMLPFAGFGIANGELRPMVVNGYWLDAGRQLVCFGNGAGQAQALVGEVERFKVYFGFDAAGFALPGGAASAAPSAGAFVDADWIRAQPAALRPWDFVVSVHVCLLVRSREQGSAPSGGYTMRGCPETAAQADGSVAPPVATYADGIARRAFMQVFTIRSQATDNPMVGM